MQVFAAAKINLHLRIGPLSGNGFHPLLSWMCTVGLFDNLTFAPAGDRQVHLTCDDLMLACDESNLVIRAARLLQKQAGKSLPGVSIHLHKRIVSGGGLGGGSSDAAATLTALNHFWDLGCSQKQLGTMAAELGSDVAFFLHGPSSICTGRGEIVRPTAPPKSKAVLLIFPGFGVSTQQVYRTFDELGLGQERVLNDEPDWRQWADLSAGLLSAGLSNDLEAPAFHLCPKLGKLRADCEQTLGRVVRMSGSGSTLFSIFDEPIEAQKAARQLASKHSIGCEATDLAPT